MSWRIRIWVSLYYDSMYKRMKKEKVKKSKKKKKESKFVWEWRRWTEYDAIIKFRHEEIWAQEGKSYTVELKERSQSWPYWTTKDLDTIWKIVIVNIFELLIHSCACVTRWRDISYIK
jgi:hypothetical protein